jgi:hypothetical protein
MSELILPGNSNMPEFRGNERSQREWLNGKPTRTEILVQLTKIEEEVNKRLVEIPKLGQTVHKIYVMARTVGLQLDTLNELLEAAAPGWEKKYDEAYKKTVLMVQFLDTVNPGGPKWDLPIRQKLEEIRAWNAQEGVKKIEGYHFLLADYILQHPDEFTQEEVDGLNVEFDMEVKLPVNPPTIQVEELPNDKEVVHEEEVSQEGTGS